jgi:hypothetical protein
VGAFPGLLESGATLWTTFCVLVETIALLQHRIGLAPVHDFVEHVVPPLSVEWVSETLHPQGIERLVRKNRRRLTFVDRVSLEFMRDVLSLDEQFREAGESPVAAGADAVRATAALPVAGAAAARGVW